MLHRALADLVLLLHLAFILFVVFGALFSLHSPRWAWLHLPALAWGIWVEAAGWICPLTPLEMRWRYLAGQAGYEGGFVEHYLVQLIYPPGLTREWQIASVIGLAILNATVYVWVLRRRKAHRNRSIRPVRGR